MTVTTAAPRTVGWRPDDSTFGARLALVRQKMAWGNVKTAATACGLPTESWRTWERDNVRPRNIIEIAAIIADRTGCDYWWLLDAPRLVEGRVVVTGGDVQRQPTEPKAAQSVRPHPIGRPPHSVPASSTRRPVRLGVAHAR